MAAENETKTTTGDTPDTSTLEQELLGNGKDTGNTEGIAKTEAETEPEIKPVAVAPAQDTAVAKALEQLAASLKPQMTVEQQEAQLAKIAEDNGMTVGALKFMGNQMQNVALAAQLPLAKRLGKKQAEEALGEHSEDLIAEVEEMVSKLPAQAQANPEAWQDAAHLILGRKMKTLKVKPQGTQRTDGGEPQRRVVTPGSGLNSVGKGSTSTGGGSKKTYSDAEKYVIEKQFHGDMADYEKWKANPKTATEKYEAGAGVGMADRELARLTQDNS